MRRVGRPRVSQIIIGGGDIKKLIIPLRSKGADDNVCDTIRPKEYEGYFFGCECEDCLGCMDENDHFEINIFEEDGFFTVHYHHQIGELCIDRYSERINNDLTIWGGIGHMEQS